MGSDLLRKYIDIIILQEAVIDEPSNELSDLFTKEGKINPEIRQTITNVMANLAKKFPQVKIIDYFITGSGVTQQYNAQSDIDTSIVLAKDTDSELINQFYSYCREIEKSVPFFKGQRPYQFTPQTKDRNQIDNVDAAYDVKNDSWIKKPDSQRVQDDYANIVANPQSKENQQYATAERSVQPTLQRLYNEINQNGPNIQRYIDRALQAYNVLKSWRSRMYSQDPKDRISQNWGPANIIYKFFTAEGYTNVFDMLKKIKNNNYTITDDDKNTILGLLEPVINDEIGFVRENENKGKVMTTTFFRKYIDILDEAVRLGYSDEQGNHFRRPESQADRDKLAQGVKKVRAYNRDMRDYHLDPTLDRPDQQAADVYNPFTAGVDSARTADREVTRGTGMLNPANSSEYTDAVDTKDTSRKLPKTSRFDGRRYGNDGVGSMGIKPRKRPELY
jgi:hypothetical protein